jgi:hypothetical protein
MLLNQPKFDSWLSHLLKPESFCEAALRTSTFSLILGSSFELPFDSYSLSQSMFAKRGPERKGFTDR